MNYSDDLSGLFAKFGGDLAGYQSFAEPVPGEQPLPENKLRPSLSAVPKVIPVDDKPESHIQVSATSRGKDSEIRGHASLAQMFQRLLESPAPHSSHSSTSPLARLRQT